MSDFMLLRGSFLICLLLYINCCSLIALSITNFLDQNQLASNGVPFSPTIIASQVASVLLNDVTDHLSSSSIGVYSSSSFSDDGSLLSESHSQDQNHHRRTKSGLSANNNNEITIYDDDLSENNNLSSRKDQISVNSLEYGSYILGKDESLSSDEFEKAEMHTNNHQSMNGINGGHNSRFYNALYPQHSGGGGGATHYNKFSSLHPVTNTHGSNGAGSSSLNLNFIHSLLTKQPSSPLISSSSPSASTSSSMSSAQNSFSASPSHQSSPKHLYYQPQMQLLQPSSLNNNHENLQIQQQQQQQNNSTIISFDSTALPMCGKQQVGGATTREPRIVGGNSTYEGEFPWAVSIQRHGNHHCGGVIVGKRWILTAAHCVRSQIVSNLIVRTGCHTLTKSINIINSHLERDYLVDQIIMHGDFTASQMKSSASINNADIALLRLKHDIHWNEFAWPVCFPNREAGNFSGHDAIVIGWGKLNEKSEDFSNELQKVKLTIIDNKVCQNWFRQAGREMPIDDRIICAGFKNGGKDACHGDSGGPLLSKINGHHVVVGVVSTGIGCARPLLPGLYSRVSSYISWIERHVS